MELIRNMADCARKKKEENTNVHRMSKQGKHKIMIYYAIIKRTMECY